MERASGAAFYATDATPLSCQRKRCFAESKSRRAVRPSVLSSISVKSIPFRGKWGVNLLFETAARLSVNAALRRLAVLNERFVSRRPNQRKRGVRAKGLHHSWSQRRLFHADSSPPLSSLSSLLKTGICANGTELSGAITPDRPSFLCASCLSLSLSFSRPSSLGPSLLRCKHE